MITLDNGLRIVTEKIPFIRSIAFGIWVMNGSRNETEETSGISHFIEHMLFKGTENRSAKDIADEIDAIGGQINAFTSKEYTCYYTRTLDSHFDVAIDVLADMFFNSKFDNVEIEKERNVILEEISMYEDTPEELVHDILQYEIWSNNSLGYPILGNRQSISKFDSNTFKSYYSSNYTPNNTVIAVAGNFDEHTIINKIQKYFGSFKGESKYKAKNYKYTPSIITKAKDIEQVHLALGFESISIGSEEAQTLAALSTVLGGGMSSRLFQKIREEHGLVYSVYSMNYSYTDTGLFSIYAALNPANIEQVLNLIISEINTLSQNICEKQLKNTKEQIKSNYILSLESSSNRMNVLGRSMLMLNKIYTQDEILEKIDAVSLDKINSLAKKIFNFNNMSISAVGDVLKINLKQMLGR